MVLTTNKVKSLINSYFLPNLVQRGFIKTHAKRGAFRARGDLIDVVSIQIGSCPGSLYLHFFTNYLPDPFKDKLSALTLGKRLSRGSNHVPWFAEDEDNLLLVLDDIWKFAENEGFTFFDQYKDVCSYKKLVETEWSNSMYPLTLSVLSAALGYGKEALVLCRRSIQNILTDEEFDIKNDEEDKFLFDTSVHDKKLADCR